MGSGKVLPCSERGDITDPAGDKGNSQSAVL